MNMEIALLLVAILFSYLSWQRIGFEKEGEIEQRLFSRFDNYYEHSNTNYMYTVSGIGITEKGFPMNLYKYLPFVKREGFADIRISFMPKEGAKTFSMPKKEEIEDHEMFFPRTEIRQVTWDQSEIDYGDILIRMKTVDENEIYNGINIILTSIHELNGGNVAEEYKDQLKYL